MNPREIFEKLNNSETMESLPLPLQFYFLMVVFPIMPIIWLCIFLTDCFDAPEWLCSILMGIYLIGLVWFFYGGSHHSPDGYGGSGCVGYSGYSSDDC